MVLQKVKWTQRVIWGSNSNSNQRPGERKLWKSLYDQKPILLYSVSLIFSCSYFRKLRMIDLFFLLKSESYFRREQMNKVGNLKRIKYQFKAGFEAMKQCHEDSTATFFSLFFLLVYFSQCLLCDRLHQIFCLNGWFNDAKLLQRI